MEDRKEERVLLNPDYVVSNDRDDQDSSFGVMLEEGFLGSGEPVIAWN